MGRDALQSGIDALHFIDAALRSGADQVLNKPLDDFLERDSVQGVSWLRVTHS